MAAASSVRLASALGSAFFLIGCATGDTIAPDGGDGSGGGTTGALTGATGTGMPSGGATMTTSGPPMMCEDAGDCPSMSACGSFECHDNACVGTFAPNGTVTPDQPASGSCQKNVCDGLGNQTSIADDANAPAGSECHVGTCAAGVPSMGVASDGTACGTGQCGGGACTPCGADGESVCVASNGCDAGHLHPIENGICVDDACAQGTGATCQCGHLNAGQEIYAAPGHDVLTSCDGRFNLVMQSDGNLVYYFGATALWSSDTFGSGARWAIMQSDGNFVLYTDGGFPVWSTQTGSAGSYFAAQDDGNLVVYQGAAALWDSDSCCH